MELFPNDLALPAGFSYRPGFITAREEQALLTAIGEQQKKSILPSCSIPLLIRDFNSGVIPDRDLTTFASCLSRS